MRKKTLWLLGISLLFLILVTVLGIVWVDAAQQVDFARKNLPPGTGGLFGTDWMGRDMLKRTVAGLSLSIRLGLLTAAISAAVALALALLASLGGGLMDSLVCGLINLVKEGNSQQPECFLSHALPPFLSLGSTSRYSPSAAAFPANTSTALMSVIPIRSGISLPSPAVTAACPSPG